MSKEKAIKKLLLAKRGFTNLNVPPETYSYTFKWLPKPGDQLCRGYKNIEICVRCVEFAKAFEGYYNSFFENFVMAYDFRSLIYDILKIDKYVMMIKYYRNKNRYLPKKAVLKILKELNRTLKLY